MPLFVLMLLLVTSVPVKAPPMTEAEQIKRQREEVQVLKKKHGNDAEKRFREQLSVL
jgi:hypothetical protein